MITDAGWMRAQRRNGQNTSREFPVWVCGHLLKRPHLSFACFMFQRSRGSYMLLRIISGSGPGQTRLTHNFSIRSDSENEVAPAVRRRDEPRILNESQAAGSAALLASMSGICLRSKNINSVCPKWTSHFDNCATSRSSSSLCVDIVGNNARKIFLCLRVIISCKRRTI